MDATEVLHRLVDNSHGFAPAEKVEAHQAITEAGGGERHWSVPDPDNPDAGRNEDTPAEADPRDAELERLRAELAERDAKDAGAKTGPAKKDTEK